MKQWNACRGAIRRGGLGCCVLAVLLTGTVRGGGVIAHWSFDKTDSDGTYRDSEGNAHPATPADAAEVKVYSGSDAPFGKAVTFLGPSHPRSYLTIPPLTNIQKTSLTIAVWVNLESPVMDFVLTDWPLAGTSSFAFGFHPFGPDKSTAQPSGHMTSTDNPRRSLVRQELRDKAVPLNSWHHFAWVWDRDQETLSSYLDGQFLAETKRGPSTGFSRTLDMYQSDRRVRIGSQETPVIGTTPANFTGSMDELWIFDEALTVMQLRRLIQTNDIRVPSAAATASTNVATATEPGASNPEPAQVAPTEPAPTDTGAAPMPAPGPSPTGRPAVGSLADRRTSPARSVGIVTCLTIIVAACCYLIWAFVERAKLRAAGQLR